MKEESGALSGILPAEPPPQPTFGERVRGAIAPMGKAMQQFGRRFTDRQTTQPVPQPSLQQLPPNIQTNVDKLRAAGAPEAEIQQYIADMGF